MALRHKSFFATLFLVALFGIMLAFAVPAADAGHCASECRTGGTIDLPCYEQCLQREDTGQIGDKCLADRQVDAKQFWEFEAGLGIPTLFGFDPSNGLEIFGWITAALFSFAAILALIFLVYGGLRYVAAAGSVSGQGIAKQRIQNAIFGLVLSLIAVGTLSLISPSLAHIGLPRLLEAQPSGGMYVPTNSIELIRILSARPHSAECEDGTPDSGGSEIEWCKGNICII